MKERDSFSHQFRLDKTIRIATDNVTAHTGSPEYNQVIPPVLGYFLLLDNSNFLLLNGENFTLL